MALQIRRGTDAERTAGGGVVFAEGELVYVTDTDKLYIGDGATAGGIILAGQSLSTIGDYIVADTINTTLDLQQNLDLNGKDIIGTGNINIAGTVTATGDINLGDDANTDTVNLAAKITSSLTPNADSTFNIGAMNARWNNGYFTGLWVDGQINAVALNGDVIADDSTVMVDASTNTLTGNLTGDVLASGGQKVLESGTDGTDATFTGDVTGDVTGNLTGNVTGNTTGYHTGDVKGSVFGDDSTPIIDAVNNTLNGNLTGNITGNVTGNVVGDITGQVKGSSSTNVLSPNTGPADAELSVLNVTATGIISGNVTGNLTGNVTGNAAGDHTGTFNGVITATGTLDGDVTGSVFADDSTPLVDAINKTLTGNLTGDVTGNVFTNLIDSADSSAIIVTPVLQVESDLIASNALIVGSGNNAGPGSENVILKNTGEILGASVVTGSISGGAVDVEVEATSKFSFKEIVTFEKFTTFQDELTIQTIAGEFTGSLTVETFTGDPDDDASVANAANYDKHFEATTTKVSFGVPAQMAVVADDTARGTLVPSPAAGMMLFMTAGTSPSATNQLQVYNGTAWVNV